MENNIELEKIILYIENVRKSKKISFYKIAKETGLNRSTVQRILEFTTKPELGNFLLIAKAVGVEISYSEIK
ncbi:hypothetical protein A0O34_15150 [Chryseobacterium glaciei]|uniref:HTH cro/C1-type domain-containing protein n=1 Tax=Chryseobacterium glaciei TaxID=1685010 RepID=A0A172XXZ9_9FLAO|nr:helix-turn-helix transcriptional regulator [Chryseobacterium glaciei]ANF51760.1 hypothetical protein A0O34_15150 [Chryseobacterium glaciei]